MCSKDDCGKLKIKDSYHTRRSKQNTYHVVNKNIASSKFTDGLKTKEGMPSGASPRLGTWVFLGYYLGGALGTPKLRFLSLLILLISVSRPKLENFNHTKLNKIFMRSISIRKEITTISAVENQLIFYFCIISNVFQLLYGKTHQIKP